MAFGDGTSASGCRNIHVPLPPPLPRYPIQTLRGQVTVTDRFGRSSHAETAFRLVILENVNGITDWLGRIGPTGFLYQIRFDAQNGSSVSGSWSRTPIGGSSLTGRFTGQLTGERDVSLALDNGATWVGHLQPGVSGSIESGWVPPLVFEIPGGPDDGATIALNFHDPY